jgi:HD-GYP domain-containing protein (c-di-GMP phosphodiesterase class II)/DNA-binding CsgD family transcriptional regulator
VRVAELAGTLSIAADLSAGMPDGHALRSAVAAAAFAEELGVGSDVARDAYYLSLFAMAGCSAEGHTAAGIVGDEILFGEKIYGRDVGRLSEVLPVLLATVTRGKSPFAALLATFRTLGRLPRMPEVSRAHCEVAAQLAGRFGFDPDFRAALLHVFERWDGSGFPDHARADALPLALRIAHVAGDANVGHRLGGIEGALTLVRKRAGRGLDPELAERFMKLALRACAGLEQPSPWSAAMDAEPSPQRMAAPDAAEEALLAMAHFADLKCRFTSGHSTGVAALCARAGRQLGLNEAQQQSLRWAGLLHDLGRVTVSTAIWEKAEPLTDAERERIRLHAYAGERVLMRAPALRTLGEIAALAHERLDGSGYHRRLPGSELSMSARVLAVADVFQALREDRPHRAAVDDDRAAAELRSMAERGALCPDAVRAVLTVGQHVVPAPARPGGLTDRELDVLRLVARGLTNKEIASALGISPKTAGHHVQHVFEKLGVRTRAAATLMAMQRGFVTTRN